MLQFATVLLLLCAGVTVVGLTSEEEAEVQALRDEVKRLQEELRTLNRTALPPSPPPRTQAVLEEVELAFLNAQQSRPTSYFLSPRKDSSPIPGFARYQAESSGVNEVTAASTLSREGITLQEDSKALCFFYATPTACDRDPLCQWGSSDTIGEKCGPRAVECSAIATTVSQCVGPNSEFENDCAWSCSCEKKTHSNTEEGGHSTAEQLCSCPKLEDNPFHIHSKDTCKMKKFYYADGTIDETCYIEQTCGHNGHHGHDPPYNILFITGSFGVGAFFRYWGPKTPILNIFPYTVLVFLLGTGFGFLTNLGYPVSNYDGLGNMDPHEIFFIFLPILIFESAFAIDYHVFKKVIVGCILLAGPGIMIAALLTGSIAKFLFTEYEWSWVTALLFGTVMSATDPVAVVALLKELGASAEISTMIEGESLFNDGTAIALFGILKEAVPNGEITKTAPEMFIDFCKISFGGPAVGLFVGFLVKISLTAVFNDALIEVTVTVFAAYVTFFVAEGFLAVSGVLGLVALGCFLGYHRSCVSPEVEHTLHHFWEITVYMTNTLIFALSGLIVSQKAFVGITPTDYLYLLITYVGVNLVRGLVVAIFMPVLGILPYKLDKANAVLVTWGGLRGAVGLALGLIVASDSTILCSHPQLGSRFLFHVSGIVVGTLLINGVTTKLVVQKLGLDKIPGLKILEMKKAHDKLVESQEKHLRGLMRQPVLADTNWQKARHFSMEAMVNPYASQSTEADDVQEKEARLGAYLKLVVQAVFHEYEEGNVGGKSARKLSALCNACSEEQRYLQASDLEDLFHLSSEWRLLTAITSPFSLLQERIEGKAREINWAHAFDVSIGFVTAHERCAENITKLLPRQSANAVIRHCKVVIIEVMKLLEWYTKEMPEIAVSIKTKHSSRHLLNAARAFCRHMEHSGMIDHDDTHALVHEVEKKMKNLRYIPHAVEPCDISVVLKDNHANWYNTRGGNAHFENGRGYTVEKFQKGSQIGEKGLEGQGFYAITLGVVRVHISGKAQYFGPGFCCNLLPALTGQTNSVTTRYSECFAETAIVAAFFSSAAVEDAVQDNETKSALWTQLGKQLSEHILGVTPPYTTWSPEKLREVCNIAKLEAVTNDRSTAHCLSNSNVNILINGRCSEVPKSEEHKPEVLKEPMRIDDIVSRNCHFWDNAVLVTVKDSLGAKERSIRNWQKLRSWMRTVRTIAGLIGTAAVRDALALALGRPTVKESSIDEDAKKQNVGNWQKEFEGTVLRKKDQRTTGFSPSSPLSNPRRNGQRTFDTVLRQNSSAPSSGEGNPLKATDSGALDDATRKRTEQERREREDERMRRDHNKQHRQELRAKKAERKRLLEEASAPSEISNTDYQYSPHSMDPASFAFRGPYGSPTGSSDFPGSAPYEYQAMPVYPHPTGPVPPSHPNPAAPTASSTQYTAPHYSASEASPHSPYSY